MADFDGLQPAKDAAKISTNSYPVGPTVDGRILYATPTLASPLNITVICGCSLIIFGVISYYCVPAVRSCFRSVHNRLVRLRMRLRPDPLCLPIAIVTSTPTRTTMGPLPHAQPHPITLSALPVTIIRTSTLEMSNVVALPLSTATHPLPRGDSSSPAGYLPTIAAPTMTTASITTPAPAPAPASLTINTAAPPLVPSPPGDLLSRRGTTIAPLLPHDLVMPSLLSPASVSSAVSSEFCLPTPTVENDAYTYGIRIEMEDVKGDKDGDEMEVEDLDDGCDGRRRRE